MSTAAELPRKVRLGRAAAITAVVLSLAGTALGAIVGTASRVGLDVIVEGGLLSFAAIGAGFGLLVWVVLPRELANRAVWVYLLVAILAGIFCISQGIFYAGLGAEGYALDAESIEVLRPVDLSLLPALGLLGSNVVVSPAIFWLLSLGLLLFPDGRLPSRRWRWVAWLAVSAGIAVSAVLAYWQGPWSTISLAEIEEEEGALITVPLVALSFATVLAFAGLLVRFRHSKGVERQQIRWILFGTSLAVPALVFAVVFSDRLNTMTVALVLLAGLAVYLLSFWIAITRYRLYEIDVVISRSIVFGVLAVLITAVYALVVVGIGSWIGAGTSSVPLSIGTTALVAVAFEPVRARIQRMANRLVYGARATPYQVLADLTTRLASAEATEGLLERMAHRLTEGTGAVRAVLRLEGHEGPAAIWPPGAAEDAPDDGEFTVPIRSTDGVLGSVSVLKARGESLTPTERGLVEDLAGSAGMVLNKVRLDADLASRAEELRVSRRRLVDAQAEERRRLERDLHDGAQQQVVALKVKLGLAERFAEQEGSASSAELIQQMASDAQDALDEIRSLGKGIFPPLLESDGLRAAVSAGAANAPIPVIVKAPALDRYGPEIEAAAYFCITEAITNAIKYSGSDRIDVHLGDRDGGLEFDVSDQGEGFDPKEHKTGSGLVGMRDRLEALGGSLSVESSPGAGTRVKGFIPARALV